MNVESGSFATEQKTDTHFLYYLVLNWILILVCEPMHFIHVKQINNLMQKKKALSAHSQTAKTIIKFIATNFVYPLKISLHVLLWDLTP